MNKRDTPGRLESRNILQSGKWQLIGTS